MRVLWSSVRNATLAEVGDRLQKGAKPFRAVTMADLVAASAEESNGLYFFLDGNTWEYVGKASSRALIERIPSHLDVRTEGWFGTLLRKLGHNRTPPAPPQACVQQALDLRLALLVADSQSVDLTEAENEFRHAFRPRLNAPRKPRSVDPAGMRLSDMEI